MLSIAHFWHDKTQPSSTYESHKFLNVTLTSGGPAGVRATGLGVVLRYAGSLGRRGNTRPLRPGFLVVVVDASVVGVGVSEPSDSSLNPGGKNLEMSTTGCIFGALISVVSLTL